MQHSDRSERDIEVAAQKFRRRSAPAAPAPDTAPDARAGRSLRARDDQLDENATEDAADSARLKILCTTDAPLRALSREATPLAPTLLINYDIPTRKVRS